MLLLHMETITVNCKNHVAYINTLGGPNEQCLALYLAVHILTTGRAYNSVFGGWVQVYIIVRLNLNLFENSV
jgi:hypothetical protein